MGLIRERIPVGFAHHKEAQDEVLMPRVDTVTGRNDSTPDRCRYPIVSREYASALRQIGTLGGGNHFIEIQKGSDGHIWIMIHSGSRNIGKQVADHYNKLAVSLNEKWHSAVPKEWELAFLPLESEEGQAYIQEMEYCVDFALANRKLMMERIKEIFMDLTSLRDLTRVRDGGTDNLFPEFVNIAHNYATMENHFGQNVLIHRKGATLAREGTIGIIPGSQGTKSYIVRGKGNKDSFESCSHGAGRKMGRKEAERSLDLAAEIKRLDDQGVVHSVRHASDLDEAPGAYKDIDVVMKNQDDLVEILVELTPLGVVKG